MNHIILTIKKISLYILGLYFLAQGTTFSVLAGVGASPLNALPLALHLISHISICWTTAIANILFIITQCILLRKWSFKYVLRQFIVGCLFSFFIYVSTLITQLFVEPTSIFQVVFYLIISLFLVTIGTILYGTSTFSALPFDYFIVTIKKRWQHSLTTAKNIRDIAILCFCLLLCLITLHTFGSIGIGTLVAIYGSEALGRYFSPKWQPKIESWLQLKHKRFGQHSN